MNKEICSVYGLYHYKDGTPFVGPILKRMLQIAVKTYPQRIKKSVDQITKDCDTNEIVRCLKILTGEEDEEDWIDVETGSKLIREWMKEEKLSEVMNMCLKPLQPVSDLLSSYDIHSVLQRYTCVENFGFKWLGVYTSSVGDMERLCSKFKETFPKYQYIGAVLNTGTVTGSHWVSVLVESDEDKTTLEYYDPFGSEPTQVIAKNLKEMLKMMIGVYDQKVFSRTSVARHQKGATHCGSYVLWYLVSRISGKNMGDLTGKQMKDKDVKKWRERLFRRRKRKLFQ